MQKSFRINEKYFSRIPTIQQRVNMGIEYLPSAQLPSYLAGFERVHGLQDAAMALRGEIKEGATSLPTREGSVEGPNNSGRKIVPLICYAGSAGQSLDRFNCRLAENSS